MKFDLRSWLVKKIAGDRLVVLNATLIYKFYPIFADIDLKPIIDKCNFTKHDKITPFALYASHMFDKVDDSVELNPKYKEAYESVIKEITDAQEKIHTKIDEEAAEYEEEGTNA